MRGSMWRVSQDVYSIEKNKRLQPTIELMNYKIKKPFTIQP